MYRLALNKLIKWKDNPRRKPLIVWGARQVGKTYLIKEMFANDFYKGNYVYIDFAVETDIRDYCETEFNPKKIMSFISSVKNTAINPSTLLIFDEVQECLGIITAMKYFCQDFREQPVIITGSMVRTKLNRVGKKRGVKTSNNSFLFPVGKINQLTIYPLNFEEFLINYNEQLYRNIKNAYQNKLPLDNAMHEHAMDVLYKFLLIGGMPEVVNTFLDEENYFESREVLKELYDNYLADMQLYQASPESILRSKMIFRSIYAELNKENKNFKSSLVEKGTKTRDMRTPIDWLITALVVHKSYLVNEKVTTPLIQDENANFRLYLADVGMFAYQSGINTTAFLTKDSKNVLSGIFFENYVAIELISKDIKLCYWKGKNDSEMEFLVESVGAVFPIDVKKGRGSLNSLEKYRNHNSNKVAIKISKNNYGYDGNTRVVTIPLYEVFLLASDLAEGCFDV